MQQLFIILRCVLLTVICLYLQSQYSSDLFFLSLHRRARGLDMGALRSAARWQAAPLRVRLVPARAGGEGMAHRHRDLLHGACGAVQAARVGGGPRVATAASHERQRQHGAGVYQTPVFFMDTHGSFGGRASPFWSSSMEMPSGERTNAMCPSRGGRLMVTPPSASR